MKHKMPHAYRGQTLLIVVLVMVVALTVGLSLILRSITNLRVATEEEDSQRAFSAAEAGIEQALKTGIGFSNKTLDNNATIKDVTVLQLSGAEFLINSGNPIEKDDSTDLWLVDHSTDGSLNYSSGWQQLTNDAKLTINWGTTADGCVNAALEVIVLSGTQNAPISKRYAWDPCTTRQSQNKFSSLDPSTEVGSFTVGGKNFTFRKTITITSSSKGILVRLNPLYYRTPIGVKGCDLSVTPPNAACNNLPSQGKIVEATGISSNAVRKVTFFQGYSKVPAEFFQHAIFSTN